MSPPSIALGGAMTPASGSSAASWNRAVASLEKLYRWAELERLVAAAPFTHRIIWRQGHGGRRARMASRNEAYERAAKRSDVRFITLEDYRAFRDVGLRGLAVDGAERPGARDRNGIRNSLFAELLVTTGLRLEEASFLLAFELAALERRAAGGRQAWLDLPSGLTKGDRGRRILVPRRLLQQLCRLYRRRARKRSRQVRGVLRLAPGRPADLHPPSSARCSLGPL